MKIKPLTITVSTPPMMQVVYSGISFPPITRVIVTKRCTIFGRFYYYCKPVWAVSAGWFLNEDENLKTS